MLHDGRTFIYSPERFEAKPINANRVALYFEEVTEGKFYIVMDTSKAKSLCNSLYQSIIDSESQEPTSHIPNAYIRDSLINSEDNKVG